MYIVWIHMDSTILQITINNQFTMVTYSTNQQYSTYLNREITIPVVTVIVNVGSAVKGLVRMMIPVMFIVIPILSKKDLLSAKMS